MEVKLAQLTETEECWFSGGRGWGEEWGDAGQRVEDLGYKINRSKDLIYSMMIELIVWEIVKVRKT